MVKVLLISVVLIALAIAGIAIKMFFKKDYQFEKKCSTVDPKTGETISACSCGGQGTCENDDEQEKTHPSVTISDLSISK
ncbi:MAG: hypothetical protein R6T91_10300 [Bacteroidales bacterium]